MKNDRVWVEIDVETNLAIRIFREKKFAVSASMAKDVCVREMRYALAVDQIRLAIFQRDEFTCVHCGEQLTLVSAEMHEKQARGNIQQRPDGLYQGGEISVANGETRCTNCHTQDEHTAHGKQRLPQFSKKASKFL